MKRLAALFLIFASQSLQASDRLSEKEWQADLTFLATELEKRHADLYHSIDPDQFEVLVRDLSKAVPELSDHEIIVRMSEVVASVGDAHTGVIYPSEGRLAFTRYPIRLAEFSDGFFVTRASEGNTDLLGGRLVAIDGIPIHQVILRVEPTLGGDNAMTRRYRRAFRLSMPDILAAIDVAETRREATFEFVLSGTKIVRQLHAENLPIEFQTETVKPNLLEAADVVGGENYRFQAIPEYEAVYFQFDSVRNDPENPFEEFIAKLGTALEEKQGHRLIIDLRQNIGGGWDLTKPLIRELIRLKRHSKGDIFVLTSPVTQSAAVVFATELRKWLDPVFVGLPTGASPNQFGEMVIFELPNSQISIAYAAAYFQTAGYESVEPWIAPDLAVETSSREYFSGDDPVLLTALTADIPADPADEFERLAREGNAAAVLALHGKISADPLRRYVVLQRPLRLAAAIFEDLGLQEDALILHRFNVASYPTHAQAHAAFAEFLDGSEAAEPARKHYQLALASLDNDPTIYAALRIVLEARIRQALKRLASTN